VQLGAFGWPELVSGMRRGANKERNCALERAIIVPPAASHSAYSVQSILFTAYYSLHTVCAGCATTVRNRFANSF